MKKLGIVGGMGSAAAAYVFQRLVDLSPANTDQEHIEVFLHNNPKVPDRTRHLIYGEESPLVEIRRSIDVLNSVGVDYIIIACLTAHYFLDALQREARAPIIDGIEQTVKFISKNYPDAEQIGILATTGTIATGLFQKSLEMEGFKGLVLNDQEQGLYCMEPIYADWGIKAGYTKGRPKERLLQGIDSLINSGARAIITGCSELPLVLGSEDVSVPLIDSIDVLLHSVIQLCFADTQE